MKRFERLSDLYVKRLMPPNWQAFDDDDGGLWASLRVFLGGYAYERQGSSPDYSSVARDVIQELQSEPFDECIASTAWHKFKQKLKNKNVNPALNPLAPEGTKYHWKSGGEKTTKKVSAVEFAAGLLPKPLAAWARDEIKGGGLKKVHAQLTTINGVGPKIASLFLRDLAVWYYLVPTLDRHVRSCRDVLRAHSLVPTPRDLLQPIDTWEAFVASEMGRVKESDHPKCADYILKKSQVPECANQGIWYFCTQVAFSSAATRRPLYAAVACCASLPYRRDCSVVTR